MLPFATARAVSSSPLQALHPHRSCSRSNVWRTPLSIHSSLPISFLPRQKEPPRKPHLASPRPVLTSVSLRRSLVLLLQRSPSLSPLSLLSFFPSRSLPSRFSLFFPLCLLTKNPLLAHREGADSPPSVCIASTEVSPREKPAIPDPRRRWVTGPLMEKGVRGISPSSSTNDTRLIRERRRGSGDSIQHNIVESNQTLRPVFPLCGRRTHTQTHTHGDTYTHTGAHTHTHTQTHTHTHPQIHTHTHTRRHTQTHTHTQTHIYVLVMIM